MCFRHTITETLRVKSHLTNSMMQRILLKPDSHLAGQEIFWFHGNRRFITVFTEGPLSLDSYFEPDITNLHLHTLFL